MKLWFSAAVLTVGSIAFAQEASQGEKSFVNMIRAQLATASKSTPPLVEDCKPEIPPGWLNRERIHRADWSAETGDVSVLSQAELDYVFNKLAIKTNLPFDMTLDGCTQRAYMMGRILEMNGIHSSRIWLERVKMGEGLMVKDKLDPSRIVGWKFHTAVSVFVQTPNGPEERVIDPSLFSKPVSPDEWVKAQTQHNPSMETRLEHFNWSNIVGTGESLESLEKKFAAHGLTWDDYAFEYSAQTMKEYTKQVEARRANGEIRPHVCIDCSERALKAVRDRNARRSDDSHSNSNGN